MYTTLLWATDGSEGAELALDEALRLLDPSGKLIVFHCDQRFLSSRAGGLPLLPDEEARRGHLRDRVAELVADGVDAELVIETTHRAVAHVIVEAAEKEHADAIVCGSRGLSGLEGALLGSVSKALLNHAHLPVVVVPPRLAVEA